MLNFSVARNHETDTNQSPRLTTQPTFGTIVGELIFRFDSPVPRMANEQQTHLQPILQDFRQALEECSQLYRSSAAESSRSNAELENESRKEFVRRMVDLSHGLVLK